MNPPSTASASSASSSNPGMASYYAGGSAAILRGGPSGPRPIPPPPDPIMARRKQINTLRIFNENVTELQPDVQYKLDFRLSDGFTDAAIFVFLPPGFPAERPSFVLGPADALAAVTPHPWLDSGGSGAVVAAPGLVNYSALSDLGRLAQVIKRELAKAPVGAVKSSATSSSTGVPAPPPQSCKPRSGLSNKHTSSTSSSSISPSPSSGGRFNTASPTGQPVPAHKQTYMSSMTGLNGLTSEELRELASSDTAAKAFCKKTKNPTRERHGKLISDTREKVEELLHENADLEAEVDSAREALARRVAEANALKREVASLHSQVGEQSRSLAPEVLVDRMRISSQEAEERSDAIAESFLAGDIAVDAFLKDYVSARAGLHGRKVKLDQLRRLRPN